MTTSIILCEGYYDRAFWDGWLEHLGCTDPGATQAGKTTRSQIIDPWGSVVRGGHHAYHSTSGQFILIEPCGGKTKLQPAARSRLGQRAAKPFDRLVLTVDPDVSAAATLTTASGLRRQDVEALVRAFDPQAATNAAGDIEMDLGATKVSLIRWEVNDSPMPGLPDQQTLERLACAALVGAYPVRAKAVQDWLHTRPSPPPTNPKEHAWSYMTGWYADQGCEAFYACLWKDPRVVAELESRLRASGAWQIAQALAS
jgi:hypothetical protein